MSNEYISPDLVGNTWIATQPCLSWAGLQSSLDDIPVLLLQSFPRAFRDLPPELSRIS